MNNAERALDAMKQAFLGDKRKIKKAIRLMMKESNDVFYKEMLKKRTFTEEDENVIVYKIRERLGLNI